MASRLVRKRISGSYSASTIDGSSQTETMIPRSLAFFLGMSPARTASSTPWAIAACTVPIRMLVYFSLFTVTLLTISVAGRTWTSELRIANTRECPFVWSPSRLAIA